MYAKAVVKNPVGDPIFLVEINKPNLLVGALQDLAEKIVKTADNHTPDSDDWAKVEIVIERRAP